MDIESYIGYYKNIVPEDLCDSIMANNWNLTKSDYANHKGAYSGSNERVKMDEVYVDATMPFWDNLKTSLSFSNKDFSKDPALTPILIEQLLSFAALRISFTFSLLPILPGFILKQFAPALADSIALL